MKELTEQLTHKMLKVINQGCGMCIYLVPDQAKHLLSLLSKDRPMTKEEMNQAIEEAKNEDSSPEITSAFEPVVWAEEAFNTQFPDFPEDFAESWEQGREGWKKEMIDFAEYFASAVASKMARENEELKKSQAYWVIQYAKKVGEIAELKNKLK